jgi:uncharacterized protein Smg (DUF494 family)
VLRSGGVLIGSDSIATPDLAEFHSGDTYVPVDPTSFPRRLDAAGFVRVTVENSADWKETFRFSAFAP